MSCRKRHRSVHRSAEPDCPSGGSGRHKGLENLSAPGETLEMTPVKVGEGPDHVPQLVELTPNQAHRIKLARGEGVESRRRAPTANAVTSQGEGVLQTTNVE